MRCAYIDCFSGIAGDMLLAALLDAGCPFETLQAAVAKLALPDVTLSAERVKRHGIAATRVVVGLPPEARRKHRHLPQIIKIIADANLSPRVTELALRIFLRLAEAEAAVHSTTPDKVHFHEVGADDALVDIVCACVGLEALGVERITCSPIPTGSGYVDCEHGRMPVPAPATAQLLRGVTIAACEETGELATPTGVAIATTLADEFGPLPQMRLDRIGTGAGARDGQTRPNILRVLIGDCVDAHAAAAESIAVLECQIDDASGETLAFAAQQMLDVGALDTFLVPIIMKKGRPGHLLTVLARPDDADRLVDAMLAHTSTFGVRRYDTRRAVLARSFESVETPFGVIRVKLGRRGDALLRAAPEYEDCAAAARAHHVALTAVQQAAIDAWNRKQDDPGPER